MKIFLATLLLSTFAFAAEKTVEPGNYKAVDVETKTIEAFLVLREDKTINFKVNTPDFTMPEPGCEGTYVIEANAFLADLTCPLDFLPHTQVQIDITDVTPENVSSEAGVDVEVVIDALGADAYKFNLHKVN